MLIIYTLLCPTNESMALERIHGWSHGFDAIFVDGIWHILARRHERWLDVDGLGGTPMAMEPPFSKYQIYQKSRAYWIILDFVQFLVNTENQPGIHILCLGSNQNSCCYCPMALPSSCRVDPKECRCWQFNTWKSTGTCNKPSCLSGIFEFQHIWLSISLFLLCIHCLGWTLDCWNII